jgi:hypothetical protein
MGELQAARMQARIARLQQVIAQRELRRVQVEWQDGEVSVVNEQNPRFPVWKSTFHMDPR